MNTMLADLFLWGAAFLLILMLAVGKKSVSGNIAGCAGWIVFAVYWLALLPGYISSGDYTNSFLVIIASGMCLISAHAFFTLFRKMQDPDDPDLADDSDDPDENPGELDEIIDSVKDMNIGTINENFNRFAGTVTQKADSPKPISSYSETTEADFRKTIRDLSMLVVVICILYFPFRSIESVGNALISSVTAETMTVLEILGTDAVRTAFDSVDLNGYGVRIILACTAIESISVLAGLIISVRAPTLRKVAALIVTVPVVYAANICRNVFVILAYGNMWFGPDSFIIAHHYIAKIGSITVLILIAVCLFRYIPEIMDMIMRIYEFYMGYIRAIAAKTGMIRDKKQKT